MTAPEPVVAVIAESFRVGSDWLSYNLGAVRVSENEWHFACLRWKVFVNEDRMRGHRFWDAVYVGRVPIRFRDFAEQMVEERSAKPR
jgi:hypothetical protein